MRYRSLRETQYPREQHYPPSEMYDPTEREDYDPRDQNGDHLCTECGEPFTKVEWDDRHWGYDGDDEFHAECCPKCSKEDDDERKTEDEAG